MDVRTRREVTTFNRPKEMADQVFTLNVLDDKNYTLSSDGGFSAVDKRARC